MIEITVTPTTATFAIDIENLSSQYWSGRMVTYSIFEGPYTEKENDLRHYTVLNLSPRAAVTDSVTFTHLHPATDYTLVVRNPWQPALQIAFHTPESTAVESIEIGEQRTDNREQRIMRSYRLNHRIVIEYDESTGRYRQILSPQR